MGRRLTRGCGAAGHVRCLVCLSHIETIGDVLGAVVRMVFEVTGSSAGTIRRGLRRIYAAAADVIARGGFDALDVDVLGGAGSLLAGHDLPPCRRKSRDP